MAWVCVDLDDTLVQQAQGEMDPTTGEEAPPQDMPVDGAVEAMQLLAGEGHRLTVFTSRFAPMPNSERQRMKEEIEQTLQALGFPPMEVWTGFSKPKADLFIDNKAVTFDGDWGLALAQAQQMLEDQGLAEGPQPGAAEQASLEGEQPEGEEQQPQGEEPPQEGA